MKLNFSNTPVSQEAIDKALSERRQKEEASKALAYAADVDACQRVVDNGRRQLKELRKAADEFAAEFKKLEGLESVPAFVEVLNTLSIRHSIGTVRPTAEYEG